MKLLCNQIIFTIKHAVTISPKHKLSLYKHYTQALLIQSSQKTALLE